LNRLERRGVGARFLLGADDVLQVAPLAHGQIPFLVNAGRELAHLDRIEGFS